MRVEISLGLLFPCALKGLPSGRHVRLDFKRSRHGRHCTIASATAGTYHRQHRKFTNYVRACHIQVWRTQGCSGSEAERMESRMDMTETRVDKLEEVGRGGGTRHHQHRLTDLNLDHIHRQDDRRIEVIANGLPIWGGAQLAVDTTIVSTPAIRRHRLDRNPTQKGTHIPRAHAQPTMSIRRPWHRNRGKMEQPTQNSTLPAPSCRSMGK